MAEQYSKEKLKEFLNALIDAKTEFGTFQPWKDEPNIDAGMRNVDCFKKVIGKTPDAYKSTVEKAIKEVRAAYDYKVGVVGTTGGIGICDYYRTKFEYTPQQCSWYLDRYGERYNVESALRDDLQKLFKLKLNDGNKGKEWLQGGVYIDEKDDYETLMSYDINQIRLYMDLYSTKDSNGHVTNLFPSPCTQMTQTGFRDGVEIEWNHMLQTGEHTDFYKSHCSGSNKGFSYNGHDSYDLNDKKEYSNDKKDGNTAIQGFSGSDEMSDDELFDKYYNDGSDTGDLYGDDDEAEEKNADETEYVQPNVIVSSKGENADDAITGAENFISIGDGNVLNTAGLQTFSTTLYNILLTAGIIVAVIIGLIIGIKFMIGSVEAKAEIKQLLVPYIVGCLVVFGAFGIWKIVVVILGQV